MAERVFLLHPGLGSITPYWELCHEEDPIVARVRAGEIRVAGIVITVPAIPPAWMPGRFLLLIDDDAAKAVEALGGRGSMWAEVTGQVEIDLERGLRACPEWLRARYRDVANGKRVVLDGVAI